MTISECRHALRPIALLIVTGLLMAACAGGATTETDDRPVVDDSDRLVPFEEPSVVRVVTHDSFAVSDEVIAEFTEQTGITVELIPAGDAVTVVNASILTAGNPVADVLFGIDQNLLSAAFEADLFDPYRPVRLDAVAPEFLLDDRSRVTPIDHGDVCVNFDRTAYSDDGRQPPGTFADLVDPAYADELVVQDPSSSTPGLAFMLATIAEFGGGQDDTEDAAWLEYWRDLRRNGVVVTDGWETAYYGQFSGGSGEGSRPLVVSYASSPPAEVTDPSVPAELTPTGVMVDTCFRQIEFAGILRGAENVRAGRAFIEFMLGTSFQQDVPEQMYVYPVRADAVLPDVFARYTAPVPQPLELPYVEIGRQRERWIQQWVSVFR